MSRRLLRATILTSTACVSLGVWALPVRGQRGDAPASDGPASAREMVKLMGQGQLTLTQAVELAEKHVDGKAVKVSCEIAEGEAQPAEPPKPGSDAPAKNKERALHGTRLLYEVNCYAQEKIHLVMVDGLARKVLGAEPKKLSDKISSRGQ